MGFRFLNMMGKREDKSNLLESGRTLGSVDTAVHEPYIKTVWTCAEIELQRCSGLMKQCTKHCDFTVSALLLASMLLLLLHRKQLKM